MAVTVKHSTPADGTFSATGAAAWDADHNFTGTIDVTNGGTGAATLTSNALLKGNGTSAVSASSITDDGTVVTIAEQVRLSSPNTSAPAWTTSGINLIQSAATFTDTSSTGTVANVYMNRFNAQTLAATNTITATNLYGTYFSDPIAGTNVTSSNRVALGADTLQVNSYFASNVAAAIYGNVFIGSTGQTVGITVGQSTATSTVNVHTGTTASGSTKTVNIGTNGASGSTTNITVGSATSGATSSITANGQVTLAPIGGSRAAWTTNGIALKQSAATWTDTTSTGTVSNVYMNRFAAQTLAATNTITATFLFGNYFSAPTAGANVTIGNTAYAIGTDNIFINGASYVGGTLTGAGTLTLTGPTTTTTAGFATGTTASGSTKTVNIGTGGASGSTTNITIGSSTSGATQTTTVNGTVTLAPIGSSAAAWTTNGIGLIQSAATFTDTTSTGTVANVYMNRFNAQTLAATNTMTATTLFGTYFNTPTAGTNVTASNRYAIGTDTLYVQGLVATYGNVDIANSTSSITASLVNGTTASGSTKTVNIGTGGASGSTTNITLGSSTSGATQTTTINGRVTLAPIGASAAAWTASGIALTQSAATWTDTSSTGTVGEVRMNNLAAQTIAASNVIAITSAFGTFLARPAAGTNVTISNAYALYAEGIYSTQASVFTSSLFANGVFQHTGGTGTQTTLLATATTASGSTKTVNIGTGGASGSTTNITIGSSTSGATSTITLNGSTTCAGTIRMQGYTVATLPAAGTAGRRAYVTDATAPTFLGALIGGGTVVTPVFDNGTAWVAG